ncbi:efflux RND transporter periplasmic adaptor subunit [Cohnella sp. CFH 77786]|uniref:efflux RND transporter periplasmic adaptor subunit n=1 Tax=Cohnella sp. CFH 77786 TaxID=2662265 RepID=UPI001C60B225|nr:efflux RND transporter periplasmic adaptor subunit [Cohnella sp. CFH 77786]MBW5448486.1 efflux RND transporter periplasmic adaptor subunit [Cohnella sp. CFH 77786]
MSNRKHPVKKLFGAALALSLVAALIAGCSAGAAKDQGAEPTDSAQPSPTVKTVKVAEIGKVQISEPREQVADVLASAQVYVVAKAGADVREIVKQRGAKVAKGDVLVILDDTDARLQQEQARLSRESAAQALESGRKQWQLNVKKLEQSLTEATKAYNKAKNDYDQGLIGKTELDQAENAYTNVKNELALLKETSVSNLEMQLKSSELSVEIADRARANLEIKAPIAGVLTELSVQQGMTVSPGTGIGQIQQTDPIKIKALLTAQAAELIRGKKQLQFYVPGDKKMFTGTVAYLADVIDTQTNAYELNLSVSNPDLALKPGMKVQVRLTDASEETVVAVPTLSIVREGADNFVYVLNGDKAEKRRIELGRLNELNQEVLSGVKAGEKLIVSGQHQLTDGEKVNVAK